MVTLLNEHGFTNHERFRATTDSAEFGITKENCRWFGTHMCGLSHRKLLKETIIEDSNPILVLEDDIEVEDKNIQYEVEIPDDADAVYFGTSQGDCNYSAIEAGNGFAKVKRIFATHAILHINPKYSEMVVKITEDAVKADGPFDVGIAYGVQEKFNVYAVKSPFFYQADSKNTVNKYEYITRIPLLLNDEESNLV
tara:strand:- start:2122 stop:2709 length:588 start_codon:yes stop_codon:yes gene_type:complete